MRRYYYKKAILFSIVFVAILSIYSSASASSACDSCLATCQGLPGCCTGNGCMCEDSCAGGSCPPGYHTSYLCSSYGDCWMVCVCDAVSVPGLLSPSDGLTNVSTIPTLGWSSVPGASTYNVRVCSNSSCSTVAASSSVSDSQWQVSPALNASTTYWWQVQAKSICKTGSWSTARTFTTVCSSPPAGTPTLENPANSSTGVYVDTTLYWSDVGCASTYDVRICRDSACSSVVAFSNIPASQWQVSPVLNTSTTYWWQIRAKNSYGDGSWSVAYKFTTSSDIPLSNGIPVNATRIYGGSVWWYYYVDIPSGATDFIVDLYNLSADADLYVKMSSKPSSFSSYNCRSYNRGTTSEKCSAASPSMDRWWIGINTYDTSKITITYTVKASWDVPVCSSVSLSPGADGFAATSALGAVTVTTPSSSSCSWTAVSNDSWISIISGNSGTGSGTVDYQISENSSGSHRTGTMTIGGQTVTIRQAKSVFMDDPNNVFSPYISSIYTEGITVGCGNNSYCPDNYVTRGEMAAFIMRAKYGENFSYTTTPYFVDVPADLNFFKYVQKMKDTAITSVNDTYMVTNYVTRQEMAAFIIRALYGESFTYTPTPYFNTDVPSTSTFFKYVQKMKDLGFTTTTDTYMAMNNVTRAEMAVFVGRAFLGME